MLSNGDILYGVGLTAAVEAVLAVVVPRWRRPLVVVTAAAVGFLATLVWQLVLGATHAREFFTDLPFRPFPVSWQDAGSGVAAFALGACPGLRSDAQGHPTGGHNVGPGDRGGRPGGGRVPLLTCGIGMSGHRSLRRVGVDRSGPETGHLMGQPVLSVVREAMSLRDAHTAIDVEVGLGMEVVPDPAHPHSAHRGHARSGEERGLRLVDEAGVDGVHQPAVHVTDRGTEHCEDGDGDQ